MTTSQSDNSSLRFTVDTHIFRELGDLLVGRDSTALAELIKNSYDADATHVTVIGSQLDNAIHGSIAIIDDGHGMDVETFRRGFLRVAGRQKELGDRRSPKLRRRYTGEKGIGRLAAHKLARRIEIISVPDRAVFPESGEPFRAVINWEAIEGLMTLDQVVPIDRNDDSPNPLEFKMLDVSEIPPEIGSHGTLIRLSPLRANWSPRERLKLYNEAVELQFPEPMLNISAQTFPGERLIDASLPKYFVRDELSSERATSFQVQLLGDFAVGETFWGHLLAQNAWLVEIDATNAGGPVLCKLTPSKRALDALGVNGEDLGSRVFELKRPESDIPEFWARLVIRSGQLVHEDSNVALFLKRTFGVRVYVEGFRILPYGEQGNDWLRLDYDYSRRASSLSDEDPEKSDHKNLGLRLPPGKAVFGTVVMTQRSSSPLKMLINREGFVPDSAFDSLTDIIKSSVNLYVRERTGLEHLAESRAKSTERPQRSSSFDQASRLLEKNIDWARTETKSAQELLKLGRVRDAEAAVAKAANALISAATAAKQVQPEESFIRILASVGMQLGAFVHEVRGVHALSLKIRTDLERHLDEYQSELPPRSRRFLRSLRLRLSDLNQSLERHASYLTETLSSDSRRRRSPQEVNTALGQALILFEPQIRRRQITVIQDIEPGLRTPPIFAPELTLIISNLLSNAIKAAGSKGTIRISGKKNINDILVTIENTGEHVDLKTSEIWFQPFQSNLADTDPLLGKGMGLGLPLTRSMVESYGGEVKFELPSPFFATAVSFTLPNKL